MYVQLLAIKHLDIDGRHRTYHPGDFVNVGKAYALRLIEAGEARAFEPVKFSLPEGCGVVLTQESVDARSRLSKLDGLSISVGSNLAYERTLFYTPGAHLPLDLLPPGFGFLERWEVAAPLFSYTILASALGDEAERQYTEDVIRDLRVPVYDTRLIFMRKCETTEQLLHQYGQELPYGGGEMLSFMRAVYKVKPHILALPITWMGHK